VSKDARCGAPRSGSQSGDANLVKGAQRVVPVGPERCGATEGEALVQADGFGLINPRFQSQQDNSLLPDMTGASAATASQERTRSARLAGWAGALIGRQSVHSDSNLQKQGMEDLQKPQVL
jgi:hypothetical protein